MTPGEFLERAGRRTMLEWAALDIGPHAPVAHTEAVLLHMRSAKAGRRALKGQ